MAGRCLRSTCRRRRSTSGHSRTREFDVTEDTRRRAASTHAITLNWGPEFADRFTLEESRTLWGRFEPLDAMLQGDEEMFEPSFQSGPMRYYYSDLPGRRGHGVVY